MQEWNSQTSLKLIWIKCQNVSSHSFFTSSYSNRQSKRWLTGKGRPFQAKGNPNPPTDRLLRKGLAQSKILWNSSRPSRKESSLRRRCLGSSTPWRRLKDPIRSSSKRDNFIAVKSRRHLPDIFKIVTCSSLDQEVTRFCTCLVIWPSRLSIQWIQRASTIFNTTKVTLGRH